MSGPEVDRRVVERLGAICLALPEVVEDDAWVGVRWSIRTKNFAHLVAIADGRPAAYAAAAGTDGPVTLLTFRAGGDDLAALAAMGPPFFKPVWFRDIVGLVLADDPDEVAWDEVTELVTDSYRLRAPKRLAALVDQRPPAGTVRADRPDRADQEGQIGCTRSGGDPAVDDDV
jgi:YjbR